MTRHTSLLLLLAMALGGCTARTGGFAVYLLSDGRPGTALLGASLGDLPLRDRPLFSQNDLAWYNSARHEMALSPEAYARVQGVFAAPIQTDGIPFVVCVGPERIYAGAFWTPLSSLSYDGVVILQPMAPDRTTLEISLGYPGSGFYRGPDPRSDPRVLEALERTGKLR